MRPLTPANCWLLFFLACLALGSEAVLSFPLFFSPGWANGWPGGLTIYRVWSTWLTITLFVMLMTIGLGAGALVSLLAWLFPSIRSHTGNVLGTWMVFWTVLCVATCCLAFKEIYASTLEMWPNGYGVG
jgi:hypothetical protein